MPVPVVEFSDERLANGLRLIVAEDHLAPVVAVNVWYDVGSKHEEPGKTGFAHLFEHVMFQGSRTWARRSTWRWCRPPAARSTARPGWTGPTTSRRCRRTSWSSRLWLEADRMGDAPRRAEPGEPRQPARGREEREALELRQPAVRVVEREAPRPPVPRGPPVPPPHDRLDGGPRRRVARRRQGVLRARTTRPTTRSCRVVGDCDRERGPRAAPSSTSARSRPTRRSRRCRDMSLPPLLGARDPRDRRGPRPAAARLHRVPGAGVRRPPPRRARPRLAAPRRRQGQPSPPPPRPRRAAGPGRRGVHAPASSAARRCASAGRRSGPASTSTTVEAAYLEELEKLAAEAPTDDELDRAKALTEADELGALAARRGARRPAVDVRDPVRRPGAHQHAPAALPRR